MWYQRDRRLGLQEAGPLGRGGRHGVRRLGAGAVLLRSLHGRPRQGEGAVLRPRAGEGPAAEGGERLRLRGLAGLRGQGRRDRPREPRAAPPHHAGRDPAPGGEEDERALAERTAVHQHLGVHQGYENLRAVPVDGEGRRRRGVPPAAAGREAGRQAGAGEGPLHHQLLARRGRPHRRARGHLPQRGAQLRGEPRALHGRPELEGAGAHVRRGQVLSEVHVQDRRGDCGGL
mmetsp:Transcript_73449/g.207430  ORF Transcript_73449/g.207430 Transcript_73449/m.207430 type:complete len:231 (+) Transcript_73449:237-929(+)